MPRHRPAVTFWLRPLPHHRTGPFNKPLSHPRVSTGPFTGNQTFLNRGPRKIPERAALCSERMSIFAAWLCFGGPPPPPPLFWARLMKLPSAFRLVLGCADRPGRQTTRGRVRRYYQGRPENVASHALNPFLGIPMIFPAPLQGVRIPHQTLQLLDIVRVDQQLSKQKVGSGRGGEGRGVHYQQAHASDELVLTSISPVRSCAWNGELRLMRLARLQYRLGNYTVAAVVALRSRARLLNHVLRSMPSAFHGACELTEFRR
jgi:hypothetical protein